MRSEFLVFEDHSCPHCGTTYKITWQTPARDSGSAECEVCHERMIQWRDSPIPSFKRRAAASRGPRRMPQLAISSRCRYARR
jgi:hypothetical protein